MTDRHRLALTTANGNEEEEVATTGAETVLEVAETANVTLPSGCRTGACASCVGRLVEGEVAYERSPRALASNDRADGYVLCCVARPLTDCRILVGPTVLREFLPDPWE